MQIILREATASDARGIARVHVESWKTTYRGLIADEYIDSIFYADREQLWAKLINFTKRLNRDSYLWHLWMTR